MTTTVVIEIENPLTGQILSAAARLDRGAVLASLPHEIAEELGFVVSARGIPVVGPVRIHLDGRHCDTSATVSGDQVVIGITALEMLAAVALAGELRGPFKTEEGCVVPEISFHDRVSD